MNRYQEMRDRHQAEFNSFDRIFFAFSKKQFEQGMEKLGLAPDETHKLFRMGSCGFIKREDKKYITEMFKRQNEEFKAAMDADKTGEGFIREMFEYELSNHEYSYTQDPEDALDALGITGQEIEATEKLHKGLVLAIEKVMAAAY